MSDRKILSFPQESGPWIVSASYIVPLPLDRRVGSFVSDADLETGLYFDMREKAFRSALLAAVREAGGARKGDLIKVSVLVSRRS